MLMHPCRPIIRALVVAFLSTAAIAGAQEQLRPLPVDALVDMNSFSFWGIGSLSPDGRWLVYAPREGARLRGKGSGGGEEHLATGMSADYTVGTNLYLVDVRTGKSERLTDDKGRYEEPVWSPDGKHIAFYSDRDGVARVWVWELSTRRMRKIADDRIHPSAFAGGALKWTPDSKSVIALLETPGPKVNRLTTLRVDPKSVKSSDSTAAAGANVRVYRAHEKKDSLTAKSAAGVDTVTLDTSSIWGDMIADLSVIRIADGAVRRVVPKRPLFWYDVSPDGKWIALAHQSVNLRAGGQSMYDYEIVPVAGGEVRTVVRHGRSTYGTATWSPDSKTLAYLASGSISNGDVFLVDVESGKERKLTTAPHPRLEYDNEWSPYWSPDGRVLFFAVDGRVWKAPVDGNAMTPLTSEGWNRDVVQIVTDHTGNQVHTTDRGATFTVTTIDPVSKDVGFYRLDANSGAATKLREEPRKYGRGRMPPVTSADGSTIVYLAEDSQHPPDIWGGTADLANPRQLTTLNPAVSSASLGRTRVIDYVGLKGQKLQGVLLLPAHYEQGSRYPMIVRVYPGPFKMGNAVHQFGVDGATTIQNMQMYASRGYAVLLPEVPQELGTPMRDLVEGVNVAVNKVIELGIADPDRLGVTGQSYGGYSTISIISQTTRFRGALMSAGMGSMVDAALEFRPGAGTDAAFWTEGGQGLMGGSLWELKQRYLENSPIMYLDRVRTPLLIVHGEDDEAVPVYMGDQIFVGLRRLGREVEYRRYPGEGHVIAGAENLTDYWNAALRWFDKHVKSAKKKDDTKITP
jgi:dipeptidyl aminopeptidase/acylaminoacyl peptidase